MRVIYDNEIFLIQKYGGATRYFYELIKRMPQYDVEVVLYMGWFINEYGLEKFEKHFSVFAGSKIKHIPRTKLISIKMQKPFFERFAVKHDFDILHQTYYADINIPKTFKRVITVHDFTHEKLSGNFSKLDKTAELKRIAIEKSDGIICVSESTRKDLSEMYNLKGKHVKVIYHGNSLKHDVTEESFVKGKYILFVGDRRSYKNFEILTELFKINDQLRNEYRLVCCGGGVFSKKEAEMISKSNLENNFIQIEARDKKIANLYYYASAFVYPSKYEGFGIPIIEAMYNKCPVIASNVSSLPEVGGDCALYFNPDSVEDLNSKINLVLNDKNLAEELKQKGFQREKEFSWDKCAKETFEFYREVNG